MITRIDQANIQIWTFSNSFTSKRAKKSRDDLDIFNCARSQLYVTHRHNSEI